MTSQEQDNCVQNTEAERTRLIRDLNDKLRRERIGGNLFVTGGICALGNSIVPQIIAAVTEFDDFTADNDPHGERDFGSLTVLGYRIFWKIDYYDADLKYGSPDPTDSDVTTRVQTIMLAHEY